jgi:signal transduction histidine kinase
LSAVLGNEYNDISVKVYDGVSTDIDSLFYQSDTIALSVLHEAGHYNRSTLMLLGNHWTIIFASQSDFFMPGEYNLAYTILFGGVAISLLVFSLMYFMSNARKSQQEAAERVKENAKLLNNVFYNVPALVGIIKASNQQYILVNSSYERFCGENLLGKKLKEAHSEIYKGFFQELDSVILKGNSFIGKEIYLKSENSQGSFSEGFFNLVYQPLSDENGNVEDLLIFAVEVTEIVKSRIKLASINEELISKNDELIRINNDLDNFIYTASHDLKAPISNIEGLLNTLKNDHQFQDEEVIMLMEMMTVSVEKFKHTIQDLTEISKSQRNIQEDVGKINFNELLNEISMQINDTIVSSNAQIISNIEVDEVNFSKKNMRSIVYNLLSNAIKYKHPDRVPQVHIHTYNEGSYTVLMVKDNGLGVDPDKIDRMFTMFSRLHDHVEGTGVGLYIVKRIIDNAGGKIEVESVPDKGLTIRVFFKQ